MAEQPVKPRKKSRRNFAKELQTLKLYCEISIELLSLGDAATNSDHLKGQIYAYKNILAKLEPRS